LKAPYRTYGKTYPLFEGEKPLHLFSNRFTAIEDKTYKASLSYFFPFAVSTEEPGSPAYVPFLYIPVIPTEYVPPNKLKESEHV
jgi:hypothetical protein